MRFVELLRAVEDVPVFETGLLLAGDVDPDDARRQLSRWTAEGKVLQLRRGIYCLAPPYQKTRPDPFLVANVLVRPSYVSGETALSCHGLIPDAAQSVVSVTTRRPGTVATSMGRFTYRHVSVDLFFGHEAGSGAFVAVPEKALLDLVYLTPGAAAESYLRELRLQRLDELDLGLLGQMAARFGGRKVRAAAEIVARLAREEDVEYRAL